jgi:hypothetical protein
MSTLNVDIIQPYSGTTVTITGLSISSSAITGSVPSASYAISASYAVTSSFATSASFASFATSASFVTSASFATTATTASFVNPLNQKVTLTGSAVGNLTALSISSNTASLDCLTANLFTLQLVSGSNTFVNPTNVQAGQTFNLLVSTTGSATVSFPAIVKQVSGSAYVPTTTTATDVLSFIAKDSSTLLLASIKNLV